MRAFSVILLSLFFSISAWAESNIPKCDSVIYDYLTEAMFVDSNSGIAVAINNKNGPNSENDFSLWNVRTGKFIESVHLVNRRQHEEIDNIKILGFKDPNTILILTWNQNDAYTQAALVAYKIKEQKEILLWITEDNFWVRNYGVSAMTALGTSYGAWHVLDLKTGLHYPLNNKSISSSDELVFSPNGKYLFGGTINSESSDSPSLKINLSRWSAADLSEVSAVANFDASDFKITSNIDAYNSSIGEIQASADGSSLYIPTQIQLAGNSTQNFVSYVDINSGNKTVCPYSVKGAIHLEIVNQSNNRILVSDTAAGYQIPMFMDAKTCKIEALPHMEGFSDNAFPSELRATQVGDRSVLFNNQSVWDAKTGKVLVKMCQ